jgi:hypothetical protein
LGAVDEIGLPVERESLGGAAVFAGVGVTGLAGAGLGGAAFIKTWPQREQRVAVSGCSHWQFGHFMVVISYPAYEREFIMKNCHACQEPWEGSPGSQPGRNETCGKCGADLHCCLNCRLYDPSASNQCQSRTTERVGDKAKRNFCDEFEFAGEKRGGGGSASGDMEGKWKDLFK